MEGTYRKPKNNIAQEGGTGSNSKVSLPIIDLTGIHDDPVL
jgi:hypothetical protein